MSAHRNPFIQLTCLNGDKLTINITKIVSFTKQEFDFRDCHGPAGYCTYIVLDGGGGAYVATHHLKEEYEDICERVASWYRSENLNPKKKEK